MAKAMEKKHLRRSRARRLPPHLLLGVLFAAGIAHAAMPIGQIPRGQLRTLTTARDAHSLTLEESARAYPVRLRAVVTYYDADIDARHPALFVHDSTGAIFIVVSAPPPTPFRPGTLIEVTGVSAPADFAPIVAKAGVRVIGESHLPVAAPRVSMTQLLTGRYDGQWVEIEGIVHSVREFGKNVSLEIAVGDGSLSATTLKEQGADYSGLIDAKVRIHANAAPVFNRNLQLTGVRLFFPNLEQLKIEEPAIADPFALPALPVDRLLRFTPNIAYRNRVHVRGRVSLQWPGRSLCIQDSARGLCVQTNQDTRLAEGELADLAGFPAIDGLTPTLTDATFRPAGRVQTLTASSVTAEQALGGEQDAKLVQIEGKLIGKDRAAKDPTMVLSSGRFLFPVVLPDRSWGRAMPVWEEGSTLRVTGICSVQVGAAETLREGLSIPASFRILLRSPEDVVVLQRPSWWSAAHLLPVLAAVLAISLCVLGWVAVLRHRVAEQTAVIREQNATLRNLSFHDGLTGIANRRTFDLTLEDEFEKASRSFTPVSLLIVDVDRFKALNDEYGHQRGDECLVRIAHALASVSPRSTDLVARYGGEEFAVILPGYEETAALALAERMRTAVLDLAIAQSGSPFNHCVSISVGAATAFPASGTTSRSLIGMADWAVYQSKLLGRNRTTSAQGGCLEAQRSPLWNARTNCPTPSHAHELIAPERR
jgi:diguanylate cyclase (GGDEF)-like protein